MCACIALQRSSSRIHSQYYCNLYTGRTRTIVYITKGKRSISLTTVDSLDLILIYISKVNDVVLPTDILLYRDYTILQCFNDGLDFYIKWKKWQSYNLKKKKKINLEPSYIPAENMVYFVRKYCFFYFFKSFKKKIKIKTFSQTTRLFIWNGAYFYFDHILWIQLCGIFKFTPQGVVLMMLAGLD